MLTKLSAVLDDFVKAAALAGLSITRAQLELRECPPPHKGLRLPKRMQALYVFMAGDQCLKVGKVGPKSNARFVSQHYGLNSRSSLARSILANPGQLSGVVPEDQPGTIESLGKHDVGDWIRASTTRFHVFLAEDSGNAALSLLEAFFHCRLNPCFEGRAPALSEGTEEE